MVIPSRTLQETGLGDQDYSKFQDHQELLWSLLIARIIYKQIDKKEERKKNKIIREWIMEDNISGLGSRWDNLRYQESSHLLNRT